MNEIRLKNERKRMDGWIRDQMTGVQGTSLMDTGSFSLILNVNPDPVDGGDNTVVGGSIRFFTPLSRPSNNNDVPR